MATNPPKADASSAAAPEKKLRLTSIIALVVALIVAAAGGFAWYQSMQGAQLPKPKVAPPPVFVPFEAITVNLQPDDAGAQYLQVSLTARVDEAVDADMMKEYMPQVRSRLLLLLSSQKASEIATADGKRKLVQEIMAKIREPYSDHGPVQRVSNIHFTSFVIQ